MILIGIDDTDIRDSPGTNQLARRLAASLPAAFECTLILRHQLFFDPRVPYTSKNGCASLLVGRRDAACTEDLLPVLRREMHAWFVAGSDPGLCLAVDPDRDRVASITAFARRCQRELVRQEEARELARLSGVHLEGFGGTEDGVIGALAAVGLLASADDGRVVHRAGWQWPDDFAGAQPVAAIRARGVDEIRSGDGRLLEEGIVDVGKHLRPSYRGARVVLIVEGADGSGGEPRWRARKLP